MAGSGLASLVRALRDVPQRSPYGLGLSSSALGFSEPSIRSTVVEVSMPQSGRVIARRFHNSAQSLPWRRGIGSGQRWYGTMGKTVERVV